MMLRCSRSRLPIRSISRRYFSSDETPPLLQLRQSNLGLGPSLIEPHLSNLTQLPEVANALVSMDPEPLERAVDIFASMKGPEYAAVLALLAEAHQARGNPTAAQQALAMIETDSFRTHVDVQLAQAKTLWFQGHFGEAQSICDDLVEIDLPLHAAAARSGQALCRLLQLQVLDDAFAVRDPARMVVKQLERYHQAALPLVAAQTNYGVAQVIYGEFVGGLQGVDVPLDPALRVWKQALTVMKRQDRKKILVSTVEARLQTNMAWGILQMKQEKDRLEQSSEFAGRGLAIYDSWPSGGDQDGLVRLLTTIATCYHQSGQAVTAEGLLQSALDKPAVTLVQKMERRNAYQAFADLCRDWEKRERDAETFDEKAKEVDESLPDGWKGRSSIHSSLWFWTPNIFAQS